MNKNNKLASPSPSRFGSYRRDKSNEGFHEDLDLRFEPWVGWDRWSSSKNLGRWISSTSKPYEPSNDHKSLTSFKSSISSLLMITTHPKSNQREREKPIHSFEPSNEHSKLLPPTSLPKKKKKTSLGSKFENQQDGHPRHSSFRNLQTYCRPGWGGFRNSKVEISQPLTFHDFNLGFKLEKKKKKTGSYIRSCSNTFY